MKPLLTLLASSLLAASVCACGSAKSTSSAPQASSGTSTSGDTSASTTSAAKSPAQQVDPAKAIVDYGHAANPADNQTITTLVRRYYTAAAADDGAKVCSLIYSIFEEAIAEDYGRPPGPASLRGKTCAVVMSKLFKQRHKQQVTDLARLQVTGVRLQGGKGYVLLSFGKTGPGRYLFVKREHSTWKINSLIDTEVPAH
jgi:hypothetical protein